MPLSVVTPGLRTADTLFHTAVLDFVLVSGFFGIKFKVKGLINIIFQVFFYSFVLSLVASLVYKSCSWIEIAKSIMPFTNGYYWFISVYLQLYLLAPFVNIVLAKSNNRQLLLLLVVFAFLVFYIGLIRGGDVCVDGKNIVNFVFVYCVGHSLYRVRAYIMNNKMKWRYNALFLLIIILSITFISNYASLSIRDFLYHYTYRYNSPGLLLMAICIFVIFETIQFQNKYINRIAVSTLAIYLFHEHPFMKDVLYKDFFSNCQGGVSWGIMTMYALILGVTAILIDVIRLRCFSLLEPVIVKVENHSYLKQK